MASGVLLAILDKALGRLTDEVQEGVPAQEPAAELEALHLFPFSKSFGVLRPLSVRSKSLSKLMIVRP